jgi:RNA polymerase sigma factor for flagellar operon FliA
MLSTRLPNVDEVWSEFQSSRSEHLQGMLLEHYLPVVKYTAERMHSRLPRAVELDDLISAGIMGLQGAIGTFDKDRGASFETYCSQRVRGAILDELRSMDWVPRLVRRRASRLSGATRTLEAYLGRLPTDREIAAELGVDFDGLRKIQQDACAVGVLSLDATIGESASGGELRECDIVVNHRSDDPVGEAQKRDLKELLRKGMNRHEKLVLTLYYYEEMTMREIAMALDITESRVSQIHSSLLARLRARVRGRSDEFTVREQVPATASFRR